MRYYFHLHECGVVTEDIEGADFASLEDANAEALAAARQIMCEEVRHGRLCLGCYILIEDDAHRPVAHLRFRDAIKIVGV